MTTDVTSVTAVTWAWRSDQQWEKFSDAMCLKLENAYAGNKQKVKVDKERFVDLSLKLSELKKNMNKVDCKDKEFVGLQRRYDDESKRRAVKRDPGPQFWKGISVFLALDDTSDAERVLRTYGATISKTVNARTKAAITKKGDCDNFKEELDKAVDLEKPIITLDWIVNSMEAGDCEDLEDDEYKFPYKNKKKEEKEKAAKKAEEKEKAAKKAVEEEKKAESKKRKKSSSSSEDEQPKLKKQKTSNSTTTTTNTTQPQVEAKKEEKQVKGKKERADAESSGLPIMISIPSQWMGVCSYAANEDFPFKMEVVSLKGKEIAGFVNWPTLGNAKTKMRGKIEGNTFEEYEAINGEDEVQIPSHYSGKISNQGKVIKGKTVAEGGTDDEDDASFQLDLVEEEESSDSEVAIPGIKEGAKLEGKYFCEFPFSLKVTKRKGDLVEGKISWAHQKCKTKFKLSIDNLSDSSQGTATSQGLKFEEYEVVSKEDDKNVVSVPMIYTGAVDSSSSALVKGQSGPDLSKLHNRFELKLSQ